MTHCWNNWFGIARRQHRTAEDGRSMTGWGAGRVVAAVALAMLGLSARADAVCVGDCNNDARVSIAEAQTCVNRSAGLTAPACAAADQNNDGTVDANEVDQCIQAFLDAATCPMVFTPGATATRTNTVGPTQTPAPPTNTAPPTATFTPTPTATIAERMCTLARNPGSKIDIHIEALPVPLGFGLSGTIAFGAGAPDGSGNSAATCSIVNLSPVNIAGIGFVCISPGSGCPIGRRDCDGGTPLGIDVNSDGNAGSCTSAASCADTCAAQCGAGGASVLTAACTGFCSGTNPASEACTMDDDCLGNDVCTAAAMPLPCCTGVDTGTCGNSNGACNGPDPVAVALRNQCQCTCVNTAAHGASDPGEVQCNLGSTLVVETGSPCGNGDVLIEVGTTCIPVTTQRATSLINDANFTPGGKVPADPNVNDLMGTALSCETLDGGTLTGLSGVGAVNFFGSALGDLAVGLRATCQ